MKSHNAWDYILITDLCNGGQPATTSGRYGPTHKPRGVSGLQLLGLCSLASVGVRRLIPVKISSSSICSFMQLAPFRSLVLWRWSQFIWQGTLNAYVWATSAVGVGSSIWTVQAAFLKGKEPPYFSLAQFIPEIVRAVIHTISCMRGNEWDLCFFCLSYCLAKNWMCSFALYFTAKCHHLSSLTYGN